MCRSSAVVAGLYGRAAKSGIGADAAKSGIGAGERPARGRVVLISPHPAHSEPAMLLCYTNMVRWAAGCDSLATQHHPPALRGHSPASLRLAWLAARQLVFAGGVCAADKRRALQALLRAPDMKDAVDAVRRQGGKLGKRGRLFAQGDGQSPRHLSKTAQRRVLKSFSTLCAYFKQQQGIVLQTRIDVARQTPPTSASPSASASASPSRASYATVYKAAASAAAASASGAKTVKKTSKKSGNKKRAKAKKSSAHASGKPAPPEHDSYSCRRAPPDKGWEPYVVHIGGPILLTAPHGLKLFRGGRAHGERLRVHLRERYSTEIVLMMAQRLGSLASFIVWNYKTAVPKDKSNRDPNYLLESQFANSAWHVALQKFVSKFRRRGLPSMHVDVHGKHNRRKTQHHIDLGIEPLIQCCANREDYGAKPLDWTVQEARLLQSRYAAALDKVFEGVNLVGKCVRCDAEPYLCGLWGHGCEHTISHQSVRLGVPAFQLEIPLSVRRHLWKTRTRMDALTDSLTDIFRGTVLAVERRHHRVLRASSEVDTEKKEGVSGATTMVAAKPDTGAHGSPTDNGTANAETMPVVASTDAGVARAVEEMLCDAKYLDARSTEKQI